MHIEPSAEVYRSVVGADIFYHLVGRVSEQRIAGFLRDLLAIDTLPKEEVVERFGQFQGEDGLSKALRQAVSIKLREHQEGTYLSRVVDTGLITAVVIREEYRKRIQRLEPTDPGLQLSAVPYGHNAVFACAASQLYDLDTLTARSWWVGDARFRLVPNGCGALVERLDLSERNFWSDVDRHPERSKVEKVTSPEVSGLNGFCASRRERVELEAVLKNYFSQECLPKHS
ncbi:MAG TPA: hypothetical protein VJG90_07695 [Candidatus Nanoarchaeia archaeon]|nr:hypothetical protein [Candidatus Nanoarchaeia archaeon]